MKSLGALQTHYESGDTTRADCWKIVRVDGTELGFTEHPDDLVIDGLTYTGSAGFNRTAMESKVGMGADNLNIQGGVDSDVVTVEDLLGRKYEGARVYHFEVNYTDPNGTKNKLNYGIIGSVTLSGGNVWVAEFTSLSGLLDQSIGDLRSGFCRVPLGSTKCGVELLPAVWQASTAYAVGDQVRASAYDGRRYVCTTAGTSNDTEGEPTWDTTIGNTTTETDGVEWETFDAWTKQGEVDSVTTQRRKFVDSSRTEEDDWFQYGKLTWTSGDNAGLSMDVKTSTDAGVIELKFDMPFDIQVGDEYTLEVGCNHLLKAAGDEWGSPYTGHCRAKFSNAANFQGDPEMTGNDKIVAGL